MTDVIIPVILALIAAIPGISALISGRHKANAETTGIEVATLRATLEEVRRDATEARKEADKNAADLKILAIAFDKLQQEFIASERANGLLQLENATLKKRVAELEAQVCELKAAVGGKAN